MGTKKCSMCKEVKSITDFNKDVSRKDGLQLRCKACHCLMMKSYYDNNKNIVLARNKQYQASHKDAILTNKREYRRNNREKIRALSRKHVALDQQRKPAKYAAKAARRRTNVRQATPQWSDADTIFGMYELAAIFKRYGIALHVDHIVPINSDIVCGLHCESNLQLLSAKDNMSKGNHHWPDMW